jgi:heat shock protein HtpX
MAGLYSQIDSNKRKTVALVVGFLMFFIVLGGAVGVVAETSGIAMSVIFFVISIFVSVFSYYKSDSIVLRISGAKEASQTDYPLFHSVTENLCIASGLPKPRLYIIEDTAMNAFATGRNPEHGVVCATTGLLSTLDRSELEGVIAHELAHIKNYDILLMSMISVLVGAINMLMDWYLHGALFGRRNSDSNSSAGGLFMAIAMLFIILSPVIATIIKLSLSRNREYLADASAVMITRNPQGLVDALKKISSDTRKLEAANSSTAHMYISNPLKNKKASGFLTNLFNTHPPVEDRINRLLSM